MSSTETENTETTETETETKNDWMTFAKKTVTSFIHILIIGLLGANFVYFTRINLDLFFPSDPKQIPYVNGQKIETKSTSIGSGCGASIDFTKSKIFENKYFSGMFEYGFPYSMESKEDTFGAIIPNWFVNKVKYSYIWLRQVIKTIINFTGSSCEMVPESMKSIVPFIIGPIAIGLIMIIASLWWIPTLISVFFNENQNWGIVISIIGLFFGWTWFIPIILAFIQIIGVLFSFILLPPMLNGSKIMEIIGEKYNSYYLTLLFLILVIISAFTNLNIIIAIVMTLVFAKHLIPPGMNPLDKKDKTDKTV